MSGEPRMEMEYADPRLPERFWAKVHPCPITGCWLWGGAVHDSLPYGMWTVDRRTARAHVSTFKATGGVITPEKPHVLHSCDQPSCVFPGHLRAGTPAENVDDARRRNRLAVGTNSPLTAADVVELRQRYADGERAPLIARGYGITTSAVSNIIRGLNWASAGGPLTFSRKRIGFPSPALARTTCKYGHRLTPENTRMKPNPACRSGFERQCITCRKRINKDMAARRKAARHAAKEQTAA